jgi:hypothetical protein
MPTGTPNSAKDNAVGEALDLPLSASVERRRLIFALSGMLKRMPADVKLRIALGKLHADDNNYNSALANVQSINMSVLYGDPVWLGNYITLASSLSLRDEVINCINRLISLSAASGISGSVFTIAANMGALDLLKRFAQDSGDMADRSEKVLDFLGRHNFLDIFSDHQRVVNNRFKGLVVDDCGFGIISDPDGTDKDAFMSFEHKLFLGFNERAALKKKILMDLAELYVSKGRKPFEWLGFISNSLIGVDVNEEIET